MDGEGQALTNIQIWLYGGAILLLLFLSGFFSGSETSLTAASKARMHQLAKEGNAPASLLNRLLERKDSLIGAPLLDNNLVNILATALASSLLISLFGEAGVALATLGMTLLVLIFAEVLPKTYAILNADRMALFIAPVIRGVVWLFAPVTNAITGIVRVLLRLLGVDAGNVGVGSSVEELRGAIELHQGQEEDEPEDVRRERAMLRAILDLGDVEVAEIMTHRRTMTMIDADLPPDQLVAQVLDSPYTRIPLYSGDMDNVVGILHAKALLREIRARHDDLTGLNIAELAAPPWYIPETATLYDQLQAFRQRKEHFALVVDEYGAMMGLVTLEDILEEIVGEIADEHDLEIEGVKPQPNGSYIVDGTVTIRDLNREFEWSLPSENYSTVAGLLLHEVRRIPNPGQCFPFFGFRFDIIRRQRNQITLVRITPPPELRRLPMLEKRREQEKAA